MKAQILAERKLGIILMLQNAHSKCNGSVDATGNANKVFFAPRKFRKLGKPVSTYLPFKCATSTSFLVGELKHWIV